MAIGMKRIPIIIFCLFLPVAMARCGKEDAGVNPDGNSHPSDTGKLYGRVIDSHTSDGIGGVTVTVSSKSVQTGSDGTYMLDGIPSGSYTVTASQKIYATVNAQVDIPANESVSCNLAMTTNETGEPNDSFAESFEIESIGIHTCYIRFPGGEDYFYINANSNYKIVVSVNQVPDLDSFGTEDLRIKIFDPSLNTVEDRFLSSPGPHEISYTTSSSGYHYIRFCSSGSSKTEAYEFSVTMIQSAFGAICGMVYDANLGTGYDVPIGVPLGAAVCVEGTAICEETSNGSFSFDFVPAGPHTVKFTHPIYQTVEEQVDVPIGGLVTMTIRMYTTESGEKNDDFSSATWIYTGTDYTGYIRSELDDDYYHLFLRSSETLVMAITEVPDCVVGGDNDLTVQIYDVYQLEKMVESLSSPGPDTLYYKPPYSRYHYIRFSSSGSNNLEPYKLRLSIAY